MPAKAIKLLAPPDYVALTPEQKADICNGCGTKGIIGELVPDDLLGADITEACCIHDYRYHTGQTIADKREADREFLFNMLSLIDARGSSWMVSSSRAEEAWIYYKAVRDGGGQAFWKDKAK